MKMEQPSYLLILITLWFLLELALPEKEISLLPTNMKIHLYPGLVEVTWDCNITESMKNSEYYIFLKNKVEKKFSVSACIFEYIVSDHMDITIHNGLAAEISIPRTSGIEKKELTAIPEGTENTAAENFSCEVYKVSIVNCSWIAGREAPKDTQYDLVIRNHNISIPCEDYRKDSFGRHVGCVLISPNIPFNKVNYIQLVGSSKETSIRFYDELLTLNNYVILDPPRNIRLNYSLNEITWERPETYSIARGQCFEYNININGVIVEVAGKRRGDSYISQKLLENEKLSISMRAKWKQNCSKNEKWSEWSEPLIHDHSSGSTPLPPHHLLIVLGVVTAAVLFILVFLSHRFRIWKRLFPQVPQPAMKFFDHAVDKEFSEQNMSKMESLPKKDEEDCICSPITEISQNDQLELMA